MLKALRKLMTLTTTSPIGNSLSNDETPYHQLFEHGMDGMMFTAPDGAILDANPAACRMFERSREEIINAGRAGLMDNSDPRMAVLLAERQRTGRAHGELTARRKNGTLFPVEMSSVIFLDAEGHSRTCLIIRDIGERKTAEHEREQLIGELQDALAKVKSLSGLLPICASCKKIRDEVGKWHVLEIYIRNHTEADFSHGICPDCQKKLYPND
ncbi:MAG: PAS domain S-box protein [Acidobacteriia bacterium]|nr:PAS domain S-box protein [Terriglobia bacterium]